MSKFFARTPRNILSQEICVPNLTTLGKILCDHIKVTDKNEAIRVPKFHHRTGHERAKRENKCVCTLSLTSVVAGGGS